MIVEPSLTNTTLTYNPLSPAFVSTAAHGGQVACDLKLVERVISSWEERKASQKISESLQRAEASSLATPLPIPPSRAHHQSEPILINTSDHPAGSGSNAKDAHPPLFLNPCRSPALLHADKEEQHMPDKHESHASGETATDELPPQTTASRPPKPSRLRTGSIQLQIQAQWARGSLESSGSPQDGQPTSAVGQGQDRRVDGECSPVCGTPDAQGGLADAGMVDVVAINLGKFR